MNKIFFFILINILTISTIAFADENFIIEDGVKIPLISKKHFVKKYRFQNGIDIRKSRGLNLDLSSDFNFNLIKPRSKNLLKYQTAPKRQLNRGLCWAFATTAALEAAFNRAYNLQFDLSEQYLAHLDKTTQYYYENGEYNFDGVNNIAENESAYSRPDEGSSVFNAALVLGLYGIPIEQKVPYNSNMTAMKESVFGPFYPMPNLITQRYFDKFEYSQKIIPLNGNFEPVFKIANIYNENNTPGIKFYYVDEVYPELIENHIAANREFIIALDWGDFTYRTTASEDKFSWNGINMWTNTPSADIQTIDDLAKYKGGHAVLVVGYNSLTKTFLIKNSHNKDIIYPISYDYVSKHAGEAMVIYSIEKSLQPTIHNKILGQWTLLINKNIAGTITIRRTHMQHFGSFYNTINMSYSGIGEKVYGIFDNQNNVKLSFIKNGQPFDFTITDLNVFQEPDGTYSAIANGTTADGQQIKLQQGGRIPANPSIGK